MKSTLNNACLSALLCGAIVVATPAFAAALGGGLGGGLGAGAGSASSNIGATGNDSFGRAVLSVRISVLIVRSPRLQLPLQPMRPATPPILQRTPLMARLIAPPQPHPMQAIVLPVLRTRPHKPTPAAAFQPGVLLPVVISTVRTHPTMLRVSIAPPRQPRATFQIGRKTMPTPQKVAQAMRSIVNRPTLARAPMDRPTLQRAK